MDFHTLELLEFPKVRDLVAGYTVSSLGKELAVQLQPLTELARIEQTLKAVTEMTEALSVRQMPPLGGLTDIRLLVRRAAIGSILSPGEMLHVKEVLAATGAVFRYRMRLEPRWQELIGMLARLEDLGPLARTIEGSIDARSNVLDMASPELGTIRHRLHELDERIQQELRRVLRDPVIRSALRFPNATLSGDHHVLPVAVNHRQKVPGIVHRTSATGDTVYVEPAWIANLNADRALIKVEEEKEIARVLRRLTAEIAKVAKPLQLALELLAQLDLIQAKAKYSLEYQMSPPRINVENRLWLRSARHPILLHLFRNKREPSQAFPAEGSPKIAAQNAMIHDARSPAAARGPFQGLESPVQNPSSPAQFPPSSLLASSSSPLTRTTLAHEVIPQEVIPIDIRLGSDYDMLVITGPNTGGKTVALKTVGLLCIMAQSGMHIPATEGSTVPLLHHVLADIGDEQSLEQSLSTFSSHISRINDIFRLADHQSLVLLDEVGAGTDPMEGAALGRAMLDYLAGMGCLAMVTTHLGDLKTYAFHNQRAENAAVEFDVQTLRPTYRLLLGQFGRSCALQIARRLQLPRELVKRAHHYLRKRTRRSGELEKLQQAREEAEKARREAQEAELAADQRRLEFEQKQSELQRQAAAEESLKAFRLTLKPGTLVKIERLDQPGHVVRVDFVKGLVMVKAGIGQWEVSLGEVLPAS
jgi:DNA mismatch repair protein MutS2